MDGDTGVRGAEELRIGWMQERRMDKLANGFMEGRRNGLTEGSTGTGEQEEVMEEARIEYRRDIKERMGCGGKAGRRVE